MPVPASGAAEVSVRSTMWILAFTLGCRWGDRAADRRERAEPERQERKGDRERNEKPEHKRVSGEGADQDDDFAALQALGYVSGSAKQDGPTGVVTWEKGRAIDGVNLVTTGHGHEILLLDMDGAELKRWTIPDPGKGAGKDYFRRGIPAPDGGVFGIVEGQLLVRFEANGSERWRVSDRNHHDVDIATDGTVWALTRTSKLIRELHPTEEIVEDAVTVYSAGGDKQRQISVLKALLASPWRSLYDGSAHPTGDVLHTNSIEILDGRAAGKNPSFKAGNLLLSSRALSALFVLDVETERIVWAHAGGHQRQHDARITDDGMLSLFDNHSPQGPSAMVVYDPTDMREVWRWGGRADEVHYSKTCGLAERLADGHAMITFTNEARAIEIDAAGQVVWEYRVPFAAAHHAELTADLFEVVRLPRSWVK